MIAQVSFFDWNSNQRHQMEKEDAQRFKFRAIFLEEFMGFLTYEVEGPRDSIEEFMNFYELDFDAIISEEGEEQ